MPKDRDYPDFIRIRDARGQTVEYARAKDRIAVHAAPEAMPAEPAFLLEDGTIGVFSADAATVDSAIAEPVYQPVGQTGSVTLAVPTGRVLVRYEAHTSAAAHAADISKAGYLIEEPLAHAPHAAWVRAEDGSIASALRNLEALESLPGVEHVEPQLIRAAARRQASG